MNSFIQHVIVRVGWNLQRWHLRLLVTIALFSLVVVAYMYVPALQHSDALFIATVLVVGSAVVAAYKAPNGIEISAMRFARKFASHIEAARIVLIELRAKEAQNYEVVALAKKTLTAIRDGYPYDTLNATRNLFQLSIHLIYDRQQPELSHLAAEILQIFGFRVYLTTDHELIEDLLPYVMTSRSPFPVFTLRAGHAEELQNLLSSRLQERRPITSLQEWRVNPAPLMEILEKAAIGDDPSFLIVFTGALLTSIAPVVQRLTLAYADHRAAGQRRSRYRTESE